MKRGWLTHATRRPHHACAAPARARDTTGAFSAEPFPDIDSRA